VEQELRTTAMLAAAATASSGVLVIDVFLDS
jgi:hypothetical protein